MAGPLPDGGSGGSASSEHNDHRVALGTYAEPGIDWTYAECSCQWEGPFRVRRVQACIDAARHLEDPTRAVVEDDWNSLTGEARRRTYEQYAAVFDSIRAIEWDR